MNFLFLTAFLFCMFNVYSTSNFRISSSDQIYNNKPLPIDLITFKSYYSKRICSLVCLKISNCVSIFSTRFSCNFYSAKYDNIGLPLLELTNQNRLFSPSSNFLCYENDRLIEAYQISSDNDNCNLNSKYIEIYRGRAQWTPPRPWPISFCGIDAVIGQNKSCYPVENCNYKLVESHFLMMREPSYYYTSEQNITYTRFKEICDDKGLAPFTSILVQFCDVEWDNLHADLSINSSNYWTGLKVNQTFFEELSEVMLYGYTPSDMRYLASVKTEYKLLKNNNTGQLLTDAVTLSDDFYDNLGNKDLDCIYMTGFRELHLIDCEADHSNLDLRPLCDTKRQRQEY